MRSFASFNKHAAIALFTTLLSSPGAGLHAQTADVGVIRVWGYKGFTAQLERWEADYTKAHPGVRFENELHSPAAVMAGLYNGVADVALMGREIWPVETMAYHWVFQQQPFGIVVATAGLNAPGQSATPVVMVHEGNPLTDITTAQLDAIYGSEHRAAPANIRTWGALGLSGAWAARPIEAYGYGAEDALGVYFRHDILRSDFKPNPASHLLSDHDSTNVSAAKRIASGVARKDAAIGYGAYSGNTEVKVLLVNGVMPTAQTLADHSYPMTRVVSVYVHREADKALDEKVDTFVHYLLSPAAQALVNPADGLLPLTPALAAKQLQKLDAPMPKDATAAAEDNQQ